MSKRIWSTVFIATVSMAAWAQPLQWFGDSRLRLALIDEPMTVEAPFENFAGTPSGETWKMPLTGGFYCDGLALEGVSFTRLPEDAPASVFLQFDVVVHLRAWSQADDKITDLEFLAIDGERELRLGTIPGIRVTAGESTSFSQTFSLSAYDFESFFGDVGSPVLRVTRSARTL